MDGYEIHFQRAENEFENYDKTKLNYLQSDIIYTTTTLKNNSYIK